LEATNLNTKRNRRWNGNLDTLSTDFLKDVIEKMESYGDQVQFELPGKAQRPHYQVITSAGRKMGFDSKNLLLRLNENGNISDDLSSIFSIDVVRAAAKGQSARTTTVRSTRSTGGASRTVAAASQPVDSVEHDKYAYFKIHRESLPDGIQKHSAHISDLMRSGMSAQDAFDAVIKQHF
jgi:hypothetical protein